MPKSRSIAWAFIVTVSALAATRLFPANLGVPEPSETRPNVRPSEASRSEVLIRLVANIADIGITPSKSSPPRGNVAQQYYDTARAAYWSKPPDYKTAAAAYSKAAELGHPGAQNGLGWLYQNGWGVPRDIERAVYWYRHAVNQGNREAQVNLGWLYEEGSGVPRDYVEAMKLYRLAAAAGEPVAQNNIGNMYLKGLGVRRDLWEAVEWFNKAAATGEARARQSLRYLKGLNRGMDPWLHILDGRPVMVTVTANTLLYLNCEIPVRLSSGKAIDVRIPIKFFTNAELRDFGILQPNGNIEMSGPPRLPHEPMRAPNDTQRQQLLAHSSDAIEIFWPPHVVIASGVNRMGPDARADVREAVELMYER